MKLLRSFFFSAMLAIGAFTVVTYTACTKDECKNVVCTHGGTCVGGTCSCPLGYQGTSCETETRATYNGDYKGTGSDNNGGTYTNFTFTYSSPGTTVTNMQIVIKNTAGTPFLTLPITLNSANSFTIQSTTLGSFTYSGSGTINTTSSSVTLNQAGTPNLVITFSTLIRQ